MAGQEWGGDIFHSIFYNLELCTPAYAALKPSKDKSGYFEKESIRISGGRRFCVLVEGLVGEAGRPYPDQALCHRVWPAGDRL